MKTVLTRPKERAPYQPFGGSRTAWISRSPELLVCGPADTGKSRGIIEKLHYCADKYKHARILMVRKTRKSLGQTAMVTYEQKVLPQGWLDTIIHFSTTDQQYEYPNGSIIAVGGMDNPEKVLSSEWDMIYPQEATELEENDWEILGMRLRNGSMPYQQLIGDCNPGPPTHWMKNRCDASLTRLIPSVHEDNPSITPERLARLDALTGVRYLRYRKGIWAAAEGMVYEEWNPAVHVCNRFEINRSWSRYWAIDWGFRNPFVLQCWAESPDGDLYLYREIYMTGVTVENHTKRIMDVTKGEPRPRAVITDHDAEDRATFEQHSGYDTVTAEKAISTGIQEVQNFLGDRDHAPILHFMRDSVLEIDQSLVGSGQPISTIDEVPSYVWDVSNGRKLKEEPVDKYNHGMDAMRYLCMFIARKRNYEITTMDQDLVQAISGYVGY